MARKTPLARVRSLRGWRAAADTGNANDGDNDEEQKPEKRRRKAYIDGANVCWAYCAALRASNNALAKIPISTALDVVCQYFREVEEFEEVVVFLPKTMRKGS